MARRPFGGGQFRQARTPREPCRMPPSRKDERLTRRISHQSVDASSLAVTRVGSEGGEVLLVGTVISEMQGAGAVASALAS
jgi:osmotically-inducible protein OsmY